MREKVIRLDGCNQFFFNILRINQAILKKGLKRSTVKISRVASRVVVRREHEHEDERHSVHHYVRY